jgi:c(7)-type cytochrome triheme protein
VPALPPAHGQLAAHQARPGHTPYFRCHTPQAQAGGRDISSCGTCHRVGRYARTPETAAAYGVNFSHSRHTSKGVSCAECHQVRPGQPQRRQVTAPVALMHHAPAGSRSCASCHDNKRAFGGDDFDDCTRCHKGNAWHF